MRIISALLMTIALAGAAAAGSLSPAEAKFVGKWISTKNADHYFVIKESGGALQVEETALSPRGGGLKTTAFKATAAADVITLNVPSGNVSMAYDKAKDALVSPGLMSQNIFKRAGK